MGWRVNSKYGQLSLVPVCFAEIVGTIRLRGNGTALLCDVLPFGINNEHYLLLIGFICSLFDKFPRSSVV